LTPDEFFGPFIRDLITIARSKGVELYNESIEQYKMRQDVVDDIVGQNDFEQQKSTKGQRKPKRYEQIEHDMVLWHCVQDKRHTPPESPLEAEHWIITVDYRFLAFDAYKRQQQGTEVPLCLHPSNFVSMLRFWVPRSPEFEEAILGTMRLPFLFQEFDSDAEKVTLQILRTIGRFEGVGDIPEEAVTRVVCNDAIRERMEEVTEGQEEVELIRDALIEELTEDIRERNAGIEELQQEATGKDQDLEELKKHKEKMEKTIAKLRSTVEAERGEVTAVQQEQQRQAEVISGLQASLEAKQAEAEKHKAISRFVIRWSIITIVALGLVAPILSYLTVKAFDWSTVWTATGVYLASALLLITAADMAGSKDCVVRDWHVFKWFRTFRGWLLGAIILGLALEMAGNYLWDRVTSPSSPASETDVRGGTSVDHEEPTVDEQKTK